MADLLAGMPVPLQRVVTFVVALFPLVLAHEFGHFVLAKLNGVRVDEFGIGFPPRLFRLTTIGGTEYTVNLLPLGGFVRLAGEDDPDVPGAFAGRSKRARAVILLAGPLANLLIAAAIFGGSAVAGPVPEALPGVAGVSVADVTDDGPADSAGVQVWDIIVAADGQLLSDPEIERQPQAGETAAIIALQGITDAATGRPMTLRVLRGIRRVQLTSLPEMLETRESTVPGVAGEEVVNAPPGGKLQPGDVLVPTTPDSLPVALAGIEVLDLTVTPELNPVYGVGQIDVTITSPVAPVQLGFVGAVWHGVKVTRLWTQTMVSALVQMILGERRADLKGPLGISDLTREAGGQGLTVFLGIMALLSINLGIINLLPIPALDGGRLLFIVAEAIRGRRVEPAREAIVHLIGFALVIGLMVVLTVAEAYSELNGGVP